MWTIILSLIFLPSRHLTIPNHGNGIETVSRMIEILHIWLSLDPMLYEIH